MSAETGEVTAREELYEIAEKLREADEKEKAGKKLKEKVRPAFFDLINEVIEDEIPLATLSENVDLSKLPEAATVDEQLERWRRNTHPEYRIVSWEGLGKVDVTLEEDPTIRKFQFVHNGFKYGRTFSMDGGGLDVEGLRARLNEESEFTEPLIALASSIKEVKHYEVDEDLMRDALTEYPELVDLVQRFINPGTPKVKLLPISKAKEEE